MSRLLDPIKNYGYEEFTSLPEGSKAQLSTLQLFSVIKDLQSSQKIVLFWETSRSGMQELVILAMCYNPYSMQNPVQSVDDSIGDVRPLDSPPKPLSNSMFEDQVFESPVPETCSGM